MAIILAYFSLTFHVQTVSLSYRQIVTSNFYYEYVVSVLQTVSIQLFSYYRVLLPRPQHINFEVF